MGMRNLISSWPLLRQLRDGDRLGGALLVAGSALIRWAVFEAGKASAADPVYTVR